MENLEDLEKTDLIQIINYYRQKISNAELELLKFEIKCNKLGTALLGFAKNPEEIVSKKSK